MTSSPAGQPSAAPNEVVGMGSRGEAGTLSAPLRTAIRKRRLGRVAVP
ncbi:hypothetical protein OG963_44140 (plasmid) [Streptomyces sp. NBC_01707]